MQLIFFKKQIIGIFWILVGIGIVSCSTQKKELQYRVLKYFLTQYDKKVAVYDSTTIYGFKQIIGIPFTKAKLKSYMLPKTYDIDSLVSEEDVKAWNQAINQYNSTSWDSTKLSGRTIINKKPSYLEEDALKPHPPGKPYPIDTILYLSPPFFNKSKDKAIIYVRQYYGPLQSTSFFYILVLRNGCWFTITKGLLSTS